MTTRTAAQALADATAAMTGGSDVTDVLDRLVRDSSQALDAQAVGLLMQIPGGDLELLSATSHQAAELELFQIQHESGPCIEAIASGAAVTATGPEEIRARWRQTGAAITDAGYQAVRAYPLRWHGHTLGAMNAFHASPSAQDSDTGLLGQALADIATVVILQTGRLSPEQISDRVQQALQARTAIEQAKGVLAYTRKLEMAAAYELLRELAATSQATLSAAAATIIADAQHRR
jgi:transcriptional regulator with GAF, ATPase, and Fis domain